MLSNKLKAIHILRSSFFVMPILVFVVVVFHFNIDFRAHQITLFVESGDVEMRGLFDVDSGFTRIETRYITVPRNTEIRTNQGAAYILLPGKSLISLDNFSSISFYQTSKDSLSVASSYGRTWHKISEALPTSQFTYQLSTPTVQLVGGGTEFELNVNNDAESDEISQVTLLEGEALVTNSRSQYIKTVNEGKRAKVAKGDQTVTVEAFSDDSIDSDFYRKNRIVKEEIDKVDPDASIESYKVALEQASSAVISSFGVDEEQTVKNTNSADNQSKEVNDSSPELTPVTNTQDNQSQDASAREQGNQDQPVPNTAPSGNANAQTPQQSNGRPATQPGSNPSQGSQTPSGDAPQNPGNSGNTPNPSAGVKQSEESLPNGLMEDTEVDSVDGFNSLQPDGAEADQTQATQNYTQDVTTLSPLFGQKEQRVSSLTANDLEDGQESSNVVVVF